MTLLPILRYPDPRLKKIAKPVGQIDKRIKTLVKDMTQTMYEAKGIGLAATQVDVHEQVVVIDVSEERNAPCAFINPRIVRQEGSETQEEGCLSVPGIYDKVTRAAAVSVEYLGLDGKLQRLDADGLLAVCIQHEIEHLQGKVFVEHLSQLKQSRIKAKLLKQARITA
jgi:peptide deformylase